MWKLVSASVQGSSHKQSGQPCQDFAFGRCLRQNDESILVVVCADGAGSSSHSDVGSQLACHNMYRLIANAIDDGLTPAEVTRELVLDWHKQVHIDLSFEAEIKGVSLRDVACTLLTAIVGTKVAVFSQIGDGAIVVRTDDGYAPVFWPQSGEYANTTNFITQECFDLNLDFKKLEVSPDEVSLFTDGIQPLVLDYVGKRAHEPFFAAMFRDLRSADDVDQLSVPLLQFLSSQRVNERTDDDKTLVLATRRTADETPPSAI
ncbi:MAG: PP2C family serine/threonine-protein phosphatase [Planctomycetota bacterium]